MDITYEFLLFRSSSSSSRSSDRQRSFLDEGGRSLQVLQATVELLGHCLVVRPYPLSERLVEGAGLEQMFCCLTSSPAGALL